MFRTLCATVGLLSLIVLPNSDGAWAQTPTAGSEKLDVEVIPDVVYDHKVGLAMSFDVLKPRKNANGAGIPVMVSDPEHKIVGH